MANLELVPVTDANKREVAALAVREEQREFLSTPDIGAFLADAHLHPSFQPYAIVVEGVVCGLISFGLLDGAPVGWWISLLVIDHGFQGRGIGRAAAEKTLALVASRSGPDATVGLGFRPENGRARQLYSRLGFSFAPEPDSNGEIIATRAAGAQAPTEIG